MAGIGTIFSVLGTVVSAAGAMQQASQEKAAADWQAKEYERQARQERASAQAEALEEDRKKGIVLSTLQTQAAGSGLGATDPTVLTLAEDITKRGTYRQQLAQFGGEDRATGLNSQATATRLSASARAAGARASAFGTILGGIGGLAKYQGGGSTTSSPNYYGFG